MNTETSPPSEPNFWIEADRIFVLKICEPISRFIQKWIGIDCFVWAYASMTVALASSLLLLLWLSNIPFEFSEVIFVPISISVIAYKAYDYLWCKETGHVVIRKRAYDSLDKGLRNPEFLKFRFSFVFFFLSGVSVLGIAVRLPLAFLLFSLTLNSPIIAYYIAKAFSACTPLPPNKSKLRQGMETLWSKLRTGATLPTPEPLPA